MKCAKWYQSNAQFTTYSQYECKTHLCTLSNVLWFPIFSSPNDGERHYSSPMWVLDTSLQFFQVVLSLTSHSFFTLMHTSLVCWKWGGLFQSPEFSLCCSVFLLCSVNSLRMHVLICRSTHYVSYTYKRFHIHIHIHSFIYPVWFLVVSGWRVNPFPNLLRAGNLKQQCWEQSPQPLPLVLGTSIKRVGYRFLIRAPYETEDDYPLCAAALKSMNARLCRRNPASHPSLLFHASLRTCTGRSHLPSCPCAVYFHVFHKAVIFYFHIKLHFIRLTSYLPYL